MKVSPKTLANKFALSLSDSYFLPSAIKVGIDEDFFWVLALFIICQKILEEAGYGPSLPRKLDQRLSVYSLIAFFIKPVSLLYSVFRTLDFSRLLPYLFFLIFLRSLINSII